MRDETKRKWRKLYNEELHKCYSYLALLGSLGQKEETGGMKKNNTAILELVRRLV
jgi:hypothetical protein